MVTGDFGHSINSTALILLGIGAGTVIASAVIDDHKETQEGANVKKEIAATGSELATINEQITALNSQLSTVPSTPAAPAQHVEDVNQQLLNKESEKKRLYSVYRKLRRENEHFLTDILSDADGVSFHRFQMAAWTLVLGIVFVKGVYENLAMPDFDTTLLGLLGLSAGTYLGLKVPEATTPKK
jgi:hypothetical protein